jgi:hypothetical protein
LPNGIVGLKLKLSEFQASTAIHENLIRAVHNNVGNLGNGKKGLQDPDSVRVASNSMLDLQHCRIRDNLSGCPKCFGNILSAGWTSNEGEVTAY